MDIIDKIKYNFFFLKILIYMKDGKEIIIENENLRNLRSLMLGVSEQYLPLLFDTFSGNVPNVVMFEKVLEKCQDAYQALLKRVGNKYVVFDKGNNSKDNFKDLDALCDRWGFHFVTSVRPSMTKIKNALKPLHVEDLPVIYEQRKTTLRGKAVSVVEL
jgi:transposase